MLIADVCLCEYTSHGHCGVVVKSGDAFDVDNDPTLELLARTAVSQAKAGADVVAPSDMMDGRVAAIRKALDAAGFEQTPILSYASKFASAFYGPSAKPPIPRRSSATAAATRWTEPISGRPCARSISTSKKART